LRTLYGIWSQRFDAKYQASGGTVYWASTSAPAVSFHGPHFSARVTRSRNENGGLGSRAMNRSRSKGR
jgi:hypothetical protein